MKGPMYRVRLGVMVLVGAVVLAGPAAVLAIGTLDQSQDLTEGFVRIDGEPASVGQSFTAGLSGTLDTVALNVARDDVMTADLVVEIRDGTPTGTLLATGTAPALDVAVFDVFGWTEISNWGAGGPATVTAGGVYVILVAAIDSSGVYYWQQSDGGNPYVAGGLFLDGVASSGTDDMTFRTYVTAAAQPTPTPRPTVTVPPTSTVSPASDAGTGTSYLALLAVLGALASGALLVATRRART
ncbi:MAG: hypothetical protein ACYC65_00185 [Candidatus Limnocylindrales bacterium]